MAESSPILVAGGINMDIIAAPSGRLMLRDSNIGTVNMRPGGVGRNIAWGIARLGLPVELCAALGADTIGAALREDCATCGIGLRYAHTLPVRSGVYFCLHDETGDMLAAINQMEAAEALLPSVLAPFWPALNKAALIVADANLPEDTLLALGENTTVPILLDPVSCAKARRALPLLPRLYAIKPNRYEAEALTGIPCNTREGAEAASDQLLCLGVERVYLSLGVEGVYYADGKERGICPSLPIPEQKGDCTGAGDAMMAALAFGAYHGLSTAQCAALGCRASRERIATGTLFAPSI